jgi:hypothetical protein
MTLRCLAGLLALSVSAAAGAVTVYDESTDGDLADTGTPQPTAISVGAGSNQVFGRTGKTLGVIDRDYFTITVAPGWQLSSITLLAGTGVVGSVSFIGVQAGTQVTVDPAGGSADGLLGWAHYSMADVGSDILPAIGNGGGASGFVPPLPAGSYAFWVQDTGTGRVDYGFDLGITAAVPEPATAATLLAGLALLGLRRRRR